MKLQFKDIINKHKNKKAIVIGHGPSLNPFLKKIKKYKEEGYIIIGCNTWFDFYPEVSPDYWVFANTIDTPKTLKEKINKYNITVIYSDSVDLTDKNWIEDNINVDYIPYDQRHFNWNKCGSCGSHGCCKSIDNSRLTLQEELQRYTHYGTHYGTGDTVALHMIAISVLLGCCDVYIIGVDLDYNLGYAKNNKNYRKPSDGFRYDQPRGTRVLNDMKILRDSAKNIGTNIFNVNKNSNWSIFNNIKDVCME